MQPPFDPFLQQQGLPLQSPLDQLQADLLAQELQAVPRPQPVITSELDRWAMRRYGTLADELPEEGLTELLTQLRSWAESDLRYWKGRNHRMVEEQDLVDLLEAEYPDDDGITETEIVTLPDPYITTKKIISMLAGGDWELDVPSRTPGNTEASQSVENFLMWWMRQANKAHAARQNGRIVRDIADKAVVRGWTCALLLPDPTNPAFPWHFELEDPLLVYPRYNSKGLVRVTRQYLMPVMDAMTEFPEAADLFDSMDEDDQVLVVGYYDDTYHCVFVEGTAAHSGTMSAELVKPPLRHGRFDNMDRPRVPWDIRTPNGSPSRSLIASRIVPGMALQEDRSELATAKVGVGLLFPMKRTYEQLNRYMSIFATILAKIDDPAILRHVDPSNPNTTDIDMGKGGRSYVAYNREKVEILSTSADPTILQTILTVFQDRLSKATVPDVFYGSAGAVTSGFGVGMLTNAAKDVLIDYINCCTDMLECIYEGVLTSYLWMAEHGLAGPIEIIASQNGQRVFGSMFDPSIIRMVGTDVEVRYLSLTNQEKLAMIQAEGQAMQFGLHSRYTAQKAVGVKDPVTESLRIAIDRAIDADPTIMGAIQPFLLEKSDEEIIRLIWYIKQQQAAMMAASSARPQGSAPAARPGQPTGVLPNQMQAGPNGGAGVAPAREDVVAQNQRATNEVVANLSGGSRPAPRWR